AHEGPRVLRFTDPRRFGCLLWQPPGNTHELLAKLGPEPLTDAFDGDLLWHVSRGRTAAVKLFLMDNGWWSAWATSTPARRCSPPASLHAAKPAACRGHATRG